MKLKAVSLSIIVIISLFIIFSTQVSAQNEESNDSTPSGIIEKLKQIENLKEKIATKVAEIRNQEKMAIYGNVIKINGKELTLSTNTGEKIISLGEDISKFTVVGGKSKEDTKRVIKENDYLTILGYKTAEGSSLAPKYIYFEEIKDRINGEIKSVDQKNFTITVTTANGDKTVDIEKSTKTLFYDWNLKKLVKSGFSKMMEGQYVHILAETVENSYSANSVLLIPKNIPSTSPTPAKSEK